MRDGRTDPRFDLYATLEVSRTASYETIEAAWRSLMKRNHPDVAGGREAAVRAQRLNIAHDWLTDPSRRARYDNATARVARPAGGSPPSPPSSRSTAGVKVEPASPYVVPLVTEWTLPLLVQRAGSLTAAEIRAMIATEEDLKRRFLSPSDRPGASHALTVARDRYIAASRNRAEADARKLETDAWRGPVWEAYRAASKAAEGGEAWASASEAASILRMAAEALRWREAVLPSQFARLLYPFVTAVGEPPRVAKPTEADSEATNGRVGCLGLLAVASVSAIAVAGIAARGIPRS